MIIWREGFKRQNYESAEEKVKEFFQLMESRGFLPYDGWMGLVFPCIKETGDAFSE